MNLKKAYEKASKLAEDLLVKGHITKEQFAFLAEFYTYLDDPKRNIRKVCNLVRNEKMYANYKDELRTLKQVLCDMK